MLQTAYELKDEGNYFFKQKDYKKAISKYCKIQLYLKPLAPPALSDDSDPSMAMMSGKK